MYDLFIQTTLIVSLGVMVYLVAAAAPRIQDSDEALTETKFKARFGEIIPLDRLDTWLNAAKDKGFRRLKVIVMKVDNFISKRLNNNGDKI
ncbi:MAG TPA: hypothetical protein VFE87_02555 [Candidatus Paceibacterota bacterium]|nr:hypothetical protein [Candidatus Paceibacterota bacterium]